MYLHIGNNVIMKREDIIGIFDLKAIKKSKNCKKFFEKLEENNNIINISEGIEESLVLAMKKNKLKGYISNISSGTLGKRCNVIE